MQKLLETYSVSEILTFLVALALAIKGAVDFFDWAKARLKKHFDLEHNEEDKEESIEQRFQKGSDTMHKLDCNQAALSATLEKLTKKVDLLIDSDKDDIKSFLTKEHHYFCYEQGWIDDYSLECCERRFAHYQDEGGNSFIEHFMEELRALPKQQPPQEEKIDK